jgi:hypothetical protein
MRVSAQSNFVCWSARELYLAGGAVLSRREWAVEEDGPAAAVCSAVSTAHTRARRGRCLLWGAQVPSWRTILAMSRWEPA